MFFLSTDSMLYVDVFPYCSISVSADRATQLRSLSMLLVFHTTNAAACKHIDTGECPNQTPDPEERCASNL